MADAKRLEFDIDFQVPVNKFTVRFPWATDCFNDQDLVLGIEAVSVDGELLGQDRVEAYYSKLFGMPFRYIEVGKIGLRAPSVGFKDVTSSQVKLTVIPWRIETAEFGEHNLGSILVTGVVAANGLYKSVIKEGTCHVEV